MQSFTFTMIIKFGHKYKILKQCQTCKCLLDWEHCMIQCPLNKASRDRLIETVSTLCPGFESQTGRDMFRSIMNLNFATSHNIRDSVIPVVVSFVMKTYKAYLSGLWDTCDICT